MARTVADLALMLDVMAAADARDWRRCRRPRDSFGAGLEDGVAGLRIAFSPELGFAAVDPEIAGLVASAAFAFAELGAHVEMVDPGFADPREAFDVLWSSGAARAIAAAPERATGSTPAWRRSPSRAARYSGPRVPAALRRARRARDRDEPLPRAVGPAAHAGDADRRVRGGPRDARGGADPRWPGWTPFTLPVQHDPAAGGDGAVRVHPAGLPAGLQIVGPRHADALVLRAARPLRPRTRRRPWPRVALRAQRVTVNDLTIDAFELLPA